MRAANEGRQCPVSLGWRGQHREHRAGDEYTSEHLMLRTVSLLLGTTLLGLMLWHLGPSRILGLLGRIGWYSIPILLVYAGNQSLRALALWICVPRPRFLTYGSALAIRLAGEAIQSLTFAGPLLANPPRPGFWSGKA
jgi:hypothetical protein